MAEAADAGHVEQLVAKMQLLPAKALIIRKRLNDAAVTQLPATETDTHTDVSAFLHNA
jgi:hypothetical protein